MRTKRELWDAILASSRMPLAGGPPVEIDGRRYIDGGMGAPIPVAEALAAGATHVLALQTRPYGVPRRSASRIGDRLIERHLRGLNPALVTLYRARIAAYERVVDGHRAALARPGRGAAARARAAPARGHALRRPARAPRRPILARAAAEAERLVERALQAGPGFRPAPAAERYSLVGLSSMPVLKRPSTSFSGESGSSSWPSLKRPWCSVAGRRPRGRCRGRSSARGPPRAGPACGRSRSRSPRRPARARRDGHGCSIPRDYPAAAPSQADTRPCAPRPLDRAPERLGHRHVGQARARASAREPS